MTLVEHPYAAAALTYLKRGVGSPIPLRARTKKPPLDGWTGYDAPYASGADVMEWSSNGRGAGNIALRLVETVIGIDVDAYGEKHGDEELARLEERLGKLPDTYVSTSRSAPSGIRYYRVPAGRAWADIAGPGIEIIHHGHRYAVVAPSIHPDTGSAYFWVWSSDWHRVAGPDLDSLPVLPEPWVEYLDRGPVSERSGKASVTDESVAEVLESFPGGSMCAWITRALDEAAHRLGEGSRHDVARHWSAVLVRAGEQGHVGAVEALDVLRKEWLVALETGEKRHPDAGEWERMVEGAVAIVLKSPTPDADRGCCGGAAGPDLSFEVSTEGVSSFWDARPILERIRLFAQSRMVNPWAVLGVVLCRAAVWTEPSIKLPPIIGGYGSLNLFVALVGSSGVGKGTAESAAGQCVSFGETKDIFTSTVGSGEGLSHLFTRRTKEGTERIRHRVLVTVPEVDNLIALGGRSGATLLSQLRVAWSGERLGFQNADPTRTVQTPAHEYRMGLVLGVQPDRAGPLLDDAGGGTPQRFVWLPALDRNMPPEKPAEPSPWGWTPYLEPPFTGPNGTVMDVPSVAVTTIEDARRAAMSGDPDALDGHSLYCRLKVAAAFAVLDSRLDVSEDDWELAGTVMRVSDATRASVRDHLAQKAKDKNRARALAQAETSIIVDETVEDHRVKRISKTLLRTLARAREAGEPSVPFRKLQTATASRDREWLETAVEGLVARGEVSVEEIDGGRHFQVLDRGAGQVLDMSSTPPPKT